MIRYKSNALNLVSMLTFSINLYVLRYAGEWEKNYNYQIVINHSLLFEDSNGTLRKKNYSKYTKLHILCLAFPLIESYRENIWYECGNMWCGTYVCKLTKWKELPLSWSLPPPHNRLIFCYWCTSDAMQFLLMIVFVFVCLYVATAGREEEHEKKNMRIRER